MAHLLLIEDDVELREELAAFLRASGHRISEAGDVATAMASLQTNPEDIDIAIIDRGLPDGDGLELAAHLRRTAAGRSISTTTGIIVMTGRGDSVDKIQGFQQGADHYLPKPVTLPELAAVVESLMRRLPAKVAWQLSVVERRLTPPQGSAVLLTTLEYAFIKELALSAGNPVARKEIVSVFGEDYYQYDPNRLDTMVRRLRQKVEKEAGTSLPVHTVRAIGFVFSAPLDILP